MFDPSQVLSQILTNITSKAQPPRPQLPSLFDYFVNNCSADLIQPAVIKKWTENHGTTQMTRMSNESSSMNEAFYSIPASFFNQVAVEVFDSLSDADRLEIQQANERAYHDAVIEYKDKMKKLYKAEDTGHGEHEALETAARVLQPVMAALEALTDLHMIGWAGGSAATGNGIGIIKISSQCSDTAEPPMIFPRSQTDILRHAAQEWMARVGGQVVEKWVGSPAYTLMEQSITQNVAKRKNPGDDIRLIKRTKTVNPVNPVNTVNTVTTGHSAEGSSMSLQSRPEVTRSSINIALQASLLEGQSQDFIVRQAPIPGPFAFPTPNKTPQRAVLVPRMFSGPQTSNAYMRHRSESLPPIRTLNQDEGSTAYRSQVTRSASEGVRMLIQNQKQRGNGTSVTGDEEYRKYYFPLIATIPISARNLRQGLDTVTRVDLGSSFRDIVTLLLELETLYGFISLKKGLPLRLRPHEVTNWIMCGRGRAGGRLTVVNIEEFSRAWWAWWTDMQPKWRERDAHDKPKQMIPLRAEEDWTCLQKPGANGMMSVVAALHGWGVAIKKQTVPLGLGDKKADWLCAVEDCGWVMGRLIESLKKKQEEEWSDGRRSEEDELEVETVDDDVDYMRGDTAYRP